VEREGGKEIKKFYKKINEIDYNLMQLLIERFSLYSKIGELKSNQEIKTFEADYQQKIIDKLSEEYFGALDRKQIKSIFSPIFRISDIAQKRK
tara:strand:+ start:184 stop:462 length:279 start_codon:yes stop_codon:yes gene_type:complete